ncbi:hypothetical protein ACCAA_200037 [Candidatus Accumulibacter aalborgensis]|uniref:Uncharacterized protein n=1 Tax=Candidatus Accumulibacter aalborgensis TaxID=1860102 RepID=A0A1A8XKP3_9PROT|nr:hypothetical protein ACCAA_200037 [Candidatus Accumulibacter aalborgensis]
MRDFGPAAGSQQSGCEIGCQRRVANDCIARLELEALVEEAGHLTVRAKSDDPIALPVAANHIQSIHPNGPR